MKKRSSNKSLPHHRLLLYMFLPWILLSCSPARKAVKQPIKEDGSAYVFDQLKKNELHFKWFTARFSADIEIDKKESKINGQIRILHDSVIWVSLTPALGIEAARIFITQDTVKFLDRIGNSYLVSDFSFINNHLNSGFDFDMLQSLLVGNDLSYYENDKFKAIIDNGQYRLNTIGRRKLKKYVRNSLEDLKVLVQSIWVDPSNSKILKIHIKELDKENKKLEADYSVFQDYAGQLAPSRLHISIQAEKQIDIGIDFSKIRIDEPSSIPFHIPENFNRIRQN